MVEAFVSLPKAYNKLFEQLSITAYPAIAVNELYGQVFCGHLKKPSESFARLFMSLHAETDRTLKIIMRRG